MNAALKLTTAPADLADFVPLAAAARALNIHRDTLGRQCRGQLAARGLAIHARPPAGGKPQWFVARSYDRRLGHGSLEHAVGEAPNLGAYSEKQRQAAWARWEIVQRFREALSAHPEPVGRWLPAFVAQVTAEVADPLRARGNPLRVSPRSVRRWHRDAPTIQHLEKLIDRRGGDQRSQGDEAFWTQFRRWFLTEDQRDKKACWRRAKAWAKDNGHAAPTYRSLLNQLDDRIPPAVQAAHRTPKAYRDQVEPTGRLDPETFAVNERWESDMRTCDVRVKLPGGRVGRPTLTAWMDWRTRRITGWVLHGYGDATTVTASLHAGITDPANRGGPPAIAWIDNGRDYLSLDASTKGSTRRKIDDADMPRVRGVFAMLGIDLHKALPHGPRGKARIERWFQTMGRQLDSFLPGHCGPSPERRPESLAKVEKDPSNLMTLELYRQHVARFIADHNASADHQIEDLADEDGRKLSPIEAFDKWLATRRVLSNPDVLPLLLMKWHKPLRVGKRGVRIEVDGQAFGYGASAPELIPFRRAPGRKARHVFAAVDPNDVSAAYIWDEQMRFICIAPMNHAGGAHGTEANRRQMKQVAADRRRFNRTLREYRQGAPLQVLHPEQRLALVASRSAAEPAPDPGADPGVAPGVAPGPGAEPTIKPVQTPLDGQVKAVQRAQLRRAVGAEITEDHRPAPSLAQLTAHHHNTPARPRRTVAAPSFQSRFGKGASS